MQLSLKMRTCPLCGGDGNIPEQLWVSGYNRTRLLNAVMQADDGITTQALFLAIYSGSNPARWPTTKVIHVLVYHANKQLRPQGYAIRCRWHGGRRGNSRYYLVKLDGGTEHKPSADQNHRSMERPQSAGTSKVNRRPGALVG